MKLKTLVQEFKLTTFANRIIIIIMDNLPNEIVLQILGYLSLGELIQCASVQKVERDLWGQIIKL